MFLSYKKMASLPIKKRVAWYHSQNNVKKFVIIRVPEISQVQALFQQHEKETK
jgi:hypothetical protein